MTGSNFRAIFVIVGRSSGPEAAQLIFGGPHVHAPPDYVLHARESLFTSKGSRDILESETKKNFIVAFTIRAVEPSQFR